MPDPANPPLRHTAGPPPNTPAFRWAELLDHRGAVTLSLPCADCRAVLTGCLLSDHCPQCGFPVAHTLAQYSNRVDQHARIAIDAGCVSCGYNLRMQSPAGRCPECGHAVAPALDETHLYERDASWVRRIASGATFLALAPLFAFGGGFMLASVSQPGPPAVSSLSRGELILNLILWIVVLALGIIGTIRVTARDPRRPAADHGSARLWVRWSFGAGAALVVAQVVVLAITTFAANNPPPAWPLWWPPGMLLPLMILSGAVGLAFAIGALALVRHLRHLMLLVPSKGMARFATIQFWLQLAVLVTYPLMVVGWIGMTNYMMGVRPVIVANTPQPAPQGGGAIVGNPAPGQPTFTHLTKSDPNVTVTTATDGTETLQHPNGTITTIDPSGTISTVGGGAGAGILTTIPNPGGGTTTTYMGFGGAATTFGGMAVAWMVLGLVSLVLSCLGLLTGITFIILLITAAVYLAKAAHKAEQRHELEMV